MAVRPTLTTRAVHLVEVHRSLGAARDVVVRGKYRLTSSSVVGGALGVEARLPTGEERDLLGTGTTQVRGFLIGSAHLGTFSPHLSGGYRKSRMQPSAPKGSRAANSRATSSTRTAAVSRYGAPRRKKRFNRSQK